MISIRDNIKRLKEKRQRLKAIQLMDQERINSNYVGRYYNDTLHTGLNNGKLVIITPEQCCIEDAKGAVNHKKAAQKVLELIKNEHIDINSLSESDFGFSLAKDEGYIVIRMVPIMIGYSTICLPEKVNTFQLQKLKEFNDYVVDFNNHTKYTIEFKISYFNPEVEYSDLELEIDKLQDCVDDTISTDDIIVYDDSINTINSK